MLQLTFKYIHRYWTKVYEVEGTWCSLINYLFRNITFLPIKVSWIRIKTVETLPKSRWPSLTSGILIILKSFSGMTYAFLDFWSNLLHLSTCELQVLFSQNKHFFHHFTFFLKNLFTFVLTSLFCLPSVLNYLLFLLSLLSCSLFSVNLNCVAVCDI